MKKIMEELKEKDFTYWEVMLMVFCSVFIGILIGYFLI